MALLTIYNDIREAVEAIVDENGEKVFHHFDIWNSQPQNENVETPLNYPAVFIEFADIQWGQLQDAGGHKTDITEEQKGELSLIKLHIVHSSLQGADISFTELHPKNIQVYFAVQAIEPTEEHSRILRKSEAQDPNHDRVQDWQMDFEFTMTQTGQVLNKTTLESGSLDTVIV